MRNLLLSLALLFSTVTHADIFKPKSVADFKRTSVRITNKEKNSGGTGIIVQSYNNATHILTNKHVCHLIEPGGLVLYNDQEYQITHYKKFPDHDLCMVRIELANLNINLEVSKDMQEPSTLTNVSGHPSLLPHILTKGHLSDPKDVDILIDVKKCTIDDMKEHPDECFLLGGLPVVQTFKSNVVSNLIKPGSSGSGVFNDDGQLMGVVFAGDSRDFSFGFIVPQLYVLYFTENQSFFKWVAVGTETGGTNSESEFDFISKCQELKFKTDKKYKQVKSLCGGLGDTLIWRK